MLETGQKFATCKDCGLFDRNAPATLTGHKPCYRTPGIYAATQPDTAICSKVRLLGTLEGNLATLALEIARLGRATGLRNGSNVGTIDDPRCDTGPEEKPRRRRAK